MTKAELLLIARPYDILFPQEIECGLVELFANLVLEQLRVVRPFGEPNILDGIAARKRASIIWKWDRHSGDGRVLKGIASEPNRHVARQEQFAEAEVNRRLTTLLQAELADVDEMMVLARNMSVELIDDADDNVIPLKVQEG